MATQARAGIGVCNDFICGSFTPNVVVSINGSALSSGSVIMDSLSVTLNRNDEPDTATFIVNRDAGVTPTAGQTVGIALGDIGNYLLAGQIVQVEHIRLSGKVSDSPEFRVTCTDWSPLFNRRLVTRDFSGQSATAIAQTIVNKYTSGFHDAGINTELATIDEFICINERPLDALRRLANLLGGGCKVNTAKVVRLWASGGNTGAYAPSAPATLTNSLATLESFTPEYDYSQVRTRVIVEGRSAKTVVDIPVAADIATYGIPIDHDGQWFFNPATDSSMNYARIGSVVVSYTNALRVTGPPYVTVTAAASPGDTSVEVDDSLGGGIDDLYGAAWMYDESGNYFVFTTIPPGGPPDLLSGIPASGYGALTVSLEVGQRLYQTGHLDSLTVLNESGAVDTAINRGDAVVVRVQYDDSAAQTAIAAIEGGDGIREHAVTDGDLTYVGCAERAVAELDTFSATLTRAAWVTRDMQAKPGAQQAIAMTSPAALSTTLTIDSVTIDFPIDNTLIATSPTSTCAATRFPRRTCHGSTVKLETILDAIKG